MATAVLGLMSGTSADGVDGVLVQFSGAPSKPKWRLLASAHHPYPRELRERLIAAGQGTALPASDWLELEDAVSAAQVDCARLTDPFARASLVGCHGQTIWHRPPEPNRLGASWQMLNGSLVAEQLQKPVVCQFRSADLARGGQGAPLVPITDRALLPAIGGWRALLNLGGIANITLLPPAQGPDRTAAVRGWDCGPANTLLDLAVQRFSGGKLQYDADGAWAAQGTVREALVEHWLQDPYLQKIPPKSTGRELFGSQDLDQRLMELEATQAPGQGLNHADALATLTAFSAAAVAADLERGPRPLELLVAGGGCRNKTLMAELQRRCRGLWVRALNEVGIPAQEREALAFALLAWWHSRSLPAGQPQITGATRPGLLGVLIRP
jgi:anhydro-N-acetylmuramic acid kinase